MSHADLLYRLLPPGAYDLGGPGIAAELAADGRALDYAQASAGQLLLESDPRTAVASLSDWERVYGLPDACVCQAGAQSIAERRAVLVAKVAMRGGQSRAFFINLAATLGYPISITELKPFNTEMDSEYPVTDEQYKYIWQVNAPLVTLRDLSSEDDTEMATAVWGNAILECVINRYKPAHTFVIFAYS